MSTTSMNHGRAVPAAGSRVKPVLAASKVHRPPKTGAEAAPASTFAAILQTPVFPQTLHQFRPAKAATSPKPPKRDNVFSQSCDTHEDRGTREIKTSQNSQTNHAR